MEFEWDEEKSTKTFKDRGITFNDAVKLWLSEDSIEVSAKSTTEERWAKIGVIEEKIHVAIFTYRTSKIRIISIRRAHPNEAKLYEQKTNNYKL